MLYYDKWYILNAGAENWSRSAITADTYTVAMNASRNGRQLYCVVTDAWGNSVTTETVTIGCDYPEDYAPPAIILQPSDAYADSGEPAVTSFTAEGTELSYQWYLRANAEASWSRSSLTGDTYSVTMIPSKSGRQVKCVVTDKYGNSVTSEEATLTCVQP